MKKIICSGCGKVFTEDAIPEKCPVCGCASSFFKEEISSNEQKESTSNDSGRKSNSTTKGLICLALAIGMFIFSYIRLTDIVITSPVYAGFTILGVYFLLKD